MEEWQSLCHVALYLQRQDRSIDNEEQVPPKRRYTSTRIHVSHPKKKLHSHHCENLRSHYHARTPYYIT
jgi:hypothetical protein